MPTAPLPALLVPSDLIASPSAGLFVAVHSGGASFETRALLAADLPTHDLVSKHSASGLTSGHLLRATGASSFAFGALTVGDPMSGGAAKNILYQGASGVLASSTSLVWDYTNSRLGIGVSSPAYVFHAVGTSGLFITADTDSDNATKQTRLGTRAYVNSQNAFVAFYLAAQLAANALNIGGGTSSGQAATEVWFYTASAVNTSTGTVRAKIDGSGDWTVARDGGRVFIGASTTPTATLDLLASSATRASLRIRAGTAPTSPNDGDIWFDGTDLKLRSGGVTYTLTKT